MDLDALGSVYGLHLVYQVLLDRFPALDTQNLLRILGALGQGLAGGHLIA